MTPQAMCADISLKLWYYTNWQLRRKGKVVLSHSSKSSRYLMVDGNSYVLRISDHGSKDNFNFPKDGELLVSWSDTVDDKVKEGIALLESVFGATPQPVAASAA